MMTQLFSRSMDRAESIPRAARQRAAQAFTLLEVIVAIGLTTIIIGVIGTAIRMYFINLKQAQANMELTELARNTLNMITSDVRGAIQYKPVDVSGLQELLDSQTAAIAGPSTGSESTGESTGPDPEGETGESGDANSDMGTANAQSTANNAASSSSSNAASSPPPEPPQNRPKFIGTQQEILVDVSRLPRLDQYHPILHVNSGGEYKSLPTDVKSVSYFVSLDAADSSPVPGGLYRREVDRATMPDDGGANLFSVDAAAKQMAPEIVDLRFRYFDGEDWQDQWDSDEVGGFPSAVEVTIVIDPGRASLSQKGRYQLSDADPNTLRMFRTVTKLPLAEILSAEEQELIANPTQFQSPSAEPAATEENR